MSWRPAGQNIVTVAPGRVRAVTARLQPYLLWPQSMQSVLLRGSGSLLDSREDTLPERAASNGYTGVDKPEMCLSDGKSRYRETTKIR